METGFRPKCSLPMESIEVQQFGELSGRELMLSPQMFETFTGFLERASERTIVARPYLHALILLLGAA
jgi:hypothetical protein